MVISGDSQRLHEEIITAGGQIQEGKFVRFDTHKEMNQALSAATDEMPSQAVQQKLLGLWQQNAEPLYKALELRSRDRADSLQRRRRGSWCRQGCQEVKLTNAGSFLTLSAGAVAGRRCTLSHIRTKIMTETEPT